MNKLSRTVLYLLPLFLLGGILAAPPRSASGAPAGQSLCDAAAYVADITAPDRTPYTPGTPFKKVWRLRNAGTCTWTAGYQLIHVSGDPLNAVASKAIGRQVAPGETIDLSIDMVAPSKAGLYNSYWMLQNEAGADFGIGPNGTGVFWTQIIVQTAPTATPILIPTSIPTTSVPPTATPVTPPTSAPPTATPVTPSTSTPTPDPTVLCDHVFFLADVTIPDGTLVQPGQKFVKTWRLKNIGTCTWKPDYQLVTWQSDTLGASAANPLNRTVLPGESVELTLNMTAPLISGKYTSYWKLRNSSGQDFGIGVRGDRAFWAEIEVNGSAPTATPTTPPAPTATATPPPAGTPCDKIGSVVDVTVPDLTEFLPWWEFIKTWRLTNGGTCTWTTGYKLVYHSGNDFKANKVVTLPKAVRPGESIDLSLTMIAPSEQNDYIGYWKLENEQGQQFGVGANANGVFWVKIRVLTNIREPYPLHQLYCQALWFTSKGVLTRCPASTANFTDGSLLFNNNPTIEGGSERKDQNTLITIPPDGANGYIQAVFPAYFVQAGDRFTTTIGCMYEAESCNVRFKFGYLDANSVYHDLISPEIQVYDANVHFVELKLDALQNKMIRFVLRVENNGSSYDDYAFWLYPTVWRDK